jgi:cytochrome c-type biogenesis protein CcmH/NrfF
MEQFQKDIIELLWQLPYILIWLGYLTFQAFKRKLVPALIKKDVQQPK